MWTSEAAYTEYRRRFDGIQEKFGGRMLVAGGAPVAIEGEGLPERLVVLFFPDLERARSGYASADYAEIAPIRRDHARTQVVTLIAGWNPAG